MSLGWTKTAPITTKERDKHWASEYTHQETDMLQISKNWTFPSNHPLACLANLSVRHKKCWTKNRSHDRHLQHLKESPSWDNIEVDTKMDLSGKIIRADLLDVLRYATSETLNTQYTNYVKIFTDGHGNVSWFST